MNDSRDPRNPYILMSCLSTMYTQTLFHPIPVVNKAPILGLNTLEARHSCSPICRALERPAYDVTNFYHDHGPHAMRCLAFRVRGAGPRGLAMGVGAWGSGFACWCSGIWGRGLRYLEV